MRRHLPVIVAMGVAVILGSAAFGTTAFAADEDTGNPFVETNNNNDLSQDLMDQLPFPKLNPKSTLVDLGVDLTDVPITPAGVTAYLASLDPQAQAILINSCTHYVATPNAAQSNYTVQFCGVLLGG
jgi:hypothetical protein